MEKLYVADGHEEDEDEDELDLNTESARRRDKAVKRELAKVDIRGRGDFIREGGLSSSSEDESSSDEDDGEDQVEEQAELPEQRNDVPAGEVTHRLAVVNLDWDNVRAMDIFATANSFVPAGGSIHSVVIYPSEFGRERMQREDIEGPRKPSQSLLKGSSNEVQREKSSHQPRRIRTTSPR